MKFNDMGRGARIELSKMAKQLGMKFIGYNPKEQQVSVEYRGKGIPFGLDEFIDQYHRMGTTAS